MSPRYSLQVRHVTSYCRMMIAILCVACQVMVSGPARAEEAEAASSTNDAKKAESSKVDALDKRVQVLEEKLGGPVGGRRLSEDVRFLSLALRNEKVEVAGEEVHKYGDASLTPSFLSCLRSDRSTVTIEQQLQQLEAAAKTNSVVGGSQLERLSAVYAAAGYDEHFYRESVRFGIFGGLIDKEDLPTLSAMARFYPAYNRHIPGRLNNWEDLIWRRLSLQVGVGTSVQDDESAAVGAIYTVGIGWDLLHHVSLFAGISQYRWKVDDKTDTRQDFSFGLTLNSEIWSGLLGAGK